MYLKFYVKNQTLIRKNRPITASGSKNYLYAEFRFSSEWSGIQKTAVFISPDESMRYHMLIENGRCAVPSELIQAGGFYVSVFGGNRITSTRVFVDVSESGIEAGLTPPVPTDDVYDQITEKINSFYDELENVSLKCPNDYITSAMIKDGAVTTSKIADKAVTGQKLADTAITESKLAFGAVTTDKISAAAVTSSKLAQGAVTEKALDSFVKARLDKTDTIENKVFSISSAEYEFECILPSGAPPLEFEGDDIYNGEYVTAQTNNICRLRINGIEPSVEDLTDNVRIPVSGTSYINFIYNINENLTEFSYSQEPVASSVENGVWRFTAYMYENINLDFTVSSSSPTGDLYSVANYFSECTQDNADTTGETYTVKYDYLITSSVGTLSDLETENKNSILEAVNENALNIKALKTEVSTANTALASMLAEGV